MVANRRSPIRFESAQELCRAIGDLDAYHGYRSLSDSFTRRVAIPFAMQLPHELSHFALVIFGAKTNWHGSFETWCGRVH